MEKETSYIYPLEEDVILRVKFTTKRGKVWRYMDEFSNSVYSGLSKKLLGYFSDYIVNHTKLASKIPPDSLIVFSLKNNPEFNQWELQKAERARARMKEKPPLVIVSIEKMKAGGIEKAKIESIKE